MEDHAGLSAGWEKKPEGAPDHPYWHQAAFEKIPGHIQFLAGDFVYLTRMYQAELQDKLTAAEVLDLFNNFKQESLASGRLKQSEEFTLYHPWLEARWKADKMQHYEVDMATLEPAAVARISKLDQVASLIQDAMDLGGMRPGLPQPVG
jgi:hypothetical protein